MARMYNPNNLSFTGHLRELRHRLGLILVCFVITLIASVFLFDYYYPYLHSLGGGKYIAIAPEEVFLEKLKVIVLVAIYCTIPYALLQVLLFIAPIFDDRKFKRKLFMIEVLGIALFLAGAIFSFKVIVPFSLSYMKELTVESGVAQSLSFERYISFVLTLTSAIGVVFEYPMCLTLLVKSKIISYRFIKKSTGIVIVVALILGAFLTPPDVISQLMVAVPLISLHFITMFFLKGK